MEQTECSETSAYKKSRRRVITQKKAYNIQNTAKAWILLWFSRFRRKLLFLSLRLRQLQVWKQTKHGFVTLCTVHWIKHRNNFDFGLIIWKEDAVAYSEISLQRTGSTEEIHIHSQSEYQTDRLVFKQARSRYKPGGLQTILLDFPCTATA